MENQVQYEDVLGKAGIQESWTLIGTSPATSTNYEVFFIAPRPVEILSISSSQRVASTSGTLNFEILDPGEALDSGDLVLVTAFSTASTANTPVTKQGSDLTVNRVLKTGQRLAAVDGGTLTNCAGLTWTVYFKFANKGHFY